MAAQAGPTSASNVTLRPVACLHCRHRRSSCSKDKPKCTRCKARGYDCVYEEARKITVNESYLRLLEEKVKTYERHHVPQSRATKRAARGLPQRQASSEDNPNDDGLEDEHPLLEPFNRLDVRSHSTSFKGPGASDNFLRSLRNLSGICDDDGRLDLIPNFYEPGALTSRREYVWSHARLPPIDICRRLFAAQYTYIGTIFAFTDPDSFELLLAEAHLGPPNLADKDACLSHSKVLITLAFGQLYSVNQWVDFKGPPGFEYFTHALQLLPDAHEEGSITCVETLALIGYFMQNMNRRDAAFLYIGMALRMAISLGLHQEVSSSPSPEGFPPLDEATREHRRRVWWSIYSLDRILSVKSGNPLTIQDEDIGVNLPSKLPNEPEYCPAVVLRHYTELSRILGEVTKSIYRRTSATEPKSGKRLMASVQSIIFSLSNWNRGLPDELRFDPARLGISRESVSTFSHYYQCINMTARPLLFHVAGKRLRAMQDDPAAKERDWKEGLSQTTVRVIEMCVSAAQETINMMTIAAQRDLVATYGYMDGEHVFSASIVLVMVCLALPANPINIAAMNAGLDLLRGMAERGNSHMGARRELLAHLCATAAAGAGLYDLILPPLSPLFTGMDTSLAIPSGAVTDHAVLDPVSHGSGGEVPLFSMAGAGSLREMFYDEGVGSVGTTDLGLWEEVFANPAVDDGSDLTRWAQEAQMVVDNGADV